jgi:hypothetical protein
MKIDAAQLRWGSPQSRAAAIEACFSEFLSESAFCLKKGEVEAAALGSGYLPEIEGHLPVIRGAIAGIISFEIVCGSGYASSGSLIDYVLSNFYSYGLAAPLRSDPDKAPYAVRLCLIIADREVCIFNGDLLRSTDGACLADAAGPLYRDSEE